MRKYPSVGVMVPGILLPRRGIGLTHWAVVACDQYTSQPNYWKQVAEQVGDLPSTFNIIFPEIYLDHADVEQRITKIQASMVDYLNQDLLEEYEGLILVERTISGRTRRGLVMCLDLDKYDYRSGSQSLIRATEGTILERLPPRIKVRLQALLEVPHILVLIDDPNQTVIMPVAQVKDHLKKLYDFDLMMDGGHLTGYQVNDPRIEQAVMKSLEKLVDPDVFFEKYHLSDTNNVLLFAVGDGNHSLATAKAIWDDLRSQLNPDHPARYALVEVVNIHDPALVFEPIHRVLFGVNCDVWTKLRTFFGNQFSAFPIRGKDAFSKMVKQVNTAQANTHSFGVIQPGLCSVIHISKSASSVAAGTLQPFLDEIVKLKCAEKIDYVHGDDVVKQLGEQTGNVGFYLPTMLKSELFRSVMLQGALPRKTFSMGEAHEKRFYMECRKIR